MSTAAAPMSAVSFPDLLRTWRHRRRLSQLGLALEAGVSQRHLSFLESGRSHPSREMILQLSETLEVPLRERNDLLVAAGFAPAFRARALDDPQMAQVMGAVRTMLASHGPFPAVAVGAAWDIRLANAAFERFVAMLGDDLWQRVGGRNLMRLFFHPQGIRPWVRNWNEVAPLLWWRARREVEAAGSRELGALLAELAPWQDEAVLWSEDLVALVPVLSLVLEKDGLRASLFTVISTFGTAQDVTADELRIETLFPADEATEVLLRALVPA
jgi:transcriptional regulator with XRE-family HTH domain